ncbi:MULTISPECIES: zinc finger protein [Actinoalloteichus]|uniref:Uncharacterized protein n=1 Tax=Actinoalloteichus fjordicus TaxID=1612552 RepID=A0AAC9PRA8_9PSEU|nr:MULTISPECIES: zinc finger protein [Actinoalloteichus]APU13928.1 hypothetical protein UA74_09320 [Actinoalloteichus fjordicus]APU19874.1 hypothetical protein UA75_09290 [Actinoalloteichus sp. GBA129-24]
MSAETTVWWQDVPTTTREVADRHAVDIRHAGPPKSGAQVETLCGITMTVRTVRRCLGRITTCRDCQDLARQLCGLPPLESDAGGRHG